MSEDKEQRVLRKTEELLAKMDLEPAPDVWDSIRSRLEPRPAPARRGWLSRHWLKSTAATAAVAAAITAWMIMTPGTPAFDEQAFLADHASMSWRAPFADKAALGLIELTGAKE